jgi:hypothetical protein
VTTIGSPKRRYPTPIPDITLQLTAESDIQEVHSLAEPANLICCNVLSLTPKFIPFKIKSAEPVVGPFAPLASRTRTLLAFDFSPFLPKDINVCVSKDIARDEVAILDGPAVTTRAIPNSNPCATLEKHCESLVHLVLTEAVPPTRLCKHKGQELSKTSKLKHNFFRKSRHIKIIST